ncbi:hypothetical protein GUJ93_ZPchr0004g39630 [Zizania palustris]|uniref:Uncharacterized protein n=1 Tax=Zizania palustris TaxID=103762 RepID=A0A8J5SNX2_ZIZPA|nr:hypothetical protein GUJ93_ZPchr0004g39630 [Zizania palustris]
MSPFITARLKPRPLYPSRPRHVNLSLFENSCEPPLPPRQAANHPPPGSPRPPRWRTTNPALPRVGGSRRTGSAASPPPIWSRARPILRSRVARGWTGLERAPGGTAEAVGEPLLRREPPHEEEQEQEQEQVDG